MAKIRLKNLNRRVQFWQNVPPWTNVVEVWAAIDWHGWPLLVNRSNVGFVIRCRMDVAVGWQVRYGMKVFTVVSISECGVGTQRGEFHFLECSPV